MQIVVRYGCWPITSHCCPAPCVKPMLMHVAQLLARPAVLHASPHDNPSEMLMLPWTNHYDVHHGLVMNCLAQLDECTCMPQGHAEGAELV
jgi:hypothetical protein